MAALRKFQYLLIPRDPAPPNFGRFMISAISMLESYFKLNRIQTERLTLIDGSITYRVHRNNMPRLPKDNKGSYVNLLTFGVFYFQNTDPTTLTAPVTSNKGWTPI